MLVLRELNSGMRCIKYTLISVNFLFVVTGIVMIIVGSTINAIYTSYSPFLEARFFSPSALLVSIGFIIFAVACLGCLGALKESTCMIMMFSFFLFIIFILEVSAGLSGYFLSNQVEDFLAQQMNLTMYNYRTDKEAKQIMDAVQKDLLCCGVKSPRDWQEIYKNGNGTLNLPESCFVNETCTDFFTYGCLPRLNFIIKESGYLLAAAAITIAFAQLTGVIFSCSLGKMLRMQKTKREQRRMLMRSQLLNNYDQLISDQKFPIPISTEEH